MWLVVVFFFFQAEDGIRDADVTGVQTCALPIFELHDLGGLGHLTVEGQHIALLRNQHAIAVLDLAGEDHLGQRDRKSTRLNSSHVRISYAVFCLKKKKKQNKTTNHICNDRNLSK